MNNSDYALIGIGLVASLLIIFPLGVGLADAQTFNSTTALTNSTGTFEIPALTNSSGTFVVPALTNSTETFINGTPIKTPNIVIPDPIPEPEILGIYNETKTHTVYLTEDNMGFLEFHYPYFETEQGEFIPYRLTQNDSMVQVEFSDGKIVFDKNAGAVTLFKNGIQVVDSDSYLVRTAQLDSDEWTFLDVNNSPVETIIQEDGDKVTITFRQQNNEGIFDVEYVIHGEIKTTAKFTNFIYPNHKFAFTQTLNLSDNIIIVNGQEVDLNQFVGQTFPREVLEQNQDLTILVSGMYYNSGIGFENLWSVGIFENNKVSLDYANVQETQTVIGETVELDPAWNGYQSIRYEMTHGSQVRTWQIKQQLCTGAGFTFCGSWSVFSSGWSVRDNWYNGYGGWKGPYLVTPTAHSPLVQTTTGHWTRANPVLSGISNGGYGIFTKTYDQPPSPPDAPTGLTATYNSTNVDLTWTAPTNNGGSAITGYKIEHSTDNVTFSTLVANTGNTNVSYTHTSPTIGQTNYYKVYAINIIGTSTASNTASDFAGTPPDAPTGLTANIQDINANPLDIYLQWSSPANVGTGTLSGFEVWRDGSLVTTVGLVTTHTDTVSSNGTYSYQVKAVSNHGTSGFSNSANVTTPNPPDAPTLTASIDNPNLNPLDITVTLAPTNDGGSTYNFTSVTSAYHRDGNNNGVCGDHYQSTTVTSSFYAGMEQSSSGVDCYVSDFAFDISSIPSNANVINVTLELQTSISYPGETFDIVSIDYDDLSSRTNAQRLASIASGNEYVNAYNMTANTLESFDLTSAVSADLSNAIGNDTYFSFGIRGNEGTQSSVPEYTGFDSHTGTNPPLLNITYTIVPTIQLYTLYNSTDGITYSTWMNTTSTSEVFVAPPVANQTYWFKASALNGVGYSNNATTFISVASNPNEPTNLQLSIPLPDTLPWQINATWSAPINDGGSAVVGYTLWRSTTFNGIYTNVTATDGNTTTFLDTTVPAPSPSNQTYWYKVQAQNLLGYGANTTAVLINTAAIPGAPNGTVLSIPLPDTLPWQINATWSAPISDGGSAVVGYTLWRSTTFNGTYTNVTATDGNTTTFLDTTVPAPSPSNQTYWYKVQAQNLVGYGANTTAVLINTVDVPIAPTSVILSIDDLGSAPYDITVSWTAPTDNGGSALLGYKVFRSLDNSNWIEVGSTGNVTSVIDTVPIGPSTTYYYQVAATNILSAYGANSTSNNITTAPAPTAPLNLSVLPRADHTSMQLTWDVPTSDGGSPIIGYKIEINIDSAGWTTVIADTGSTTTTYIDTGRTTDTNYKYRVSAITLVGTGSPSITADAEFTTAVLTPIVTSLAGNAIQFDVDVNMTYGIPDSTVFDVELRYWSSGNLVTQIVPAPSDSVAKNNSVNYTMWDNIEETTDYYILVKTTNGVSGEYLEFQTGKLTATPTLRFDDNLIGKEYRNSTFTGSVLTMIGSPNDFDLVVVYREQNNLGNVIVLTWKDVISDVNLTTPVDATKRYYVSGYYNPNFNYTVGGSPEDGTATIPVAYPVDISLVSMPDPNQVGLVLGIDTIAGDSGIFGLPIVFIFIIALASIFTGRSAPMGIIFIGVAMGMMAYLGLIDFNFDPANNSNIATWAIIIVAIIIGVMIGKRWD